MSTIQTFSGNGVYLLSPDPNTISIRDIAHSLSNLCRFVGHTKRFYSVAEHCLWCVHGCSDTRITKWCLMHDAAEAYIGDLSRPLRTLIPLLDSIEANLLTVIAQKFGLQLPVPKAVWEIDDRIGATESRDLMFDSRNTHWEYNPDDSFPFSVVEPYSPYIEMDFICMFNKLFGS